MTTLESHINIKSIDKSDWKVYKFSEIAKSISERVEPTETELKTYVGLEHLDSESIHIKRFGKRDDVTGTKLRCYPGDIIFARRRAYQRKAAVVEFDGFCSAHSLVLRANPNVIDSKLFPFFLHSDTFMHRAVDISVGSLSPTINWGTLKNEKFLLPPKDQQARLAELLWAADEMVESLHIALNKTITTKRTVFNRSLKNSDYQIISDIGNVSYGLGQPPAIDDNGVGMVRATNISRGKISEQNLMKVNRDAIPKGREAFLKSGDIIVVRSGAYTGDIGLITDEWEGSVAGYDLVLRIDKCKANSLWLTEYLLEDECQKRFKADSIRSAQPHLNSEQVMNTPIPNIKKLEQDSMAAILEKHNSVIAALEQQVRSTKELQKSLINQIF